MSARPTAGMGLVGHYIQINQPDLVIASIRLVIERAK
jgi:hypothetical protein